MDEKVSELLDLTKKLLDQAKEIVTENLPPSQSLDFKKARYSIFLRVQMSEALKFGYGAYYSCKQGWGHGGIGSARSIYEIFVDIKYINENEIDRNERVERFVDYASELICRDMEKALERGLKISQKQQDQIRNDYHQIIEKYHQKHKEELALGVEKEDATPGYKRFYWSGISIADMAKRVNLGEAHQALYGQLSDLSHVSARKMLSSIANFTKNQIEVYLNFGPEHEHCFPVLNVIFLCIYGILEEYMAYFGIEPSCYPILEKILEDRGKLENRRKGQSESG